MGDVERDFLASRGSLDIKRGGGRGPSREARDGAEVDATARKLLVRGDSKDSPRRLVGDVCRAGALTAALRS